MKFKELSREFRRELYNAIRLSVFVTAVVLGFLVFQNRTVNQEEIDQFAAGSPEATRTETGEPTPNRLPASEKR